MKKSTLTGLVALALFSGSQLSQASTTMTLQGTTYNVDTVCHMKVGPGTTETSLHLTGPASIKLHYLTIDKTIPGVKLKAVKGADKVAGTETVGAMATRHDTDNLTYFAGTNGDFYLTQGSAANNVSIVGTPVGNCTDNGEVYVGYTGYASILQETDGDVHLGILDYTSGTASSGGKTAPFRGINIDSQGNAVTLYTSRYYGITNQTAYAGNCYEVTAKLVEGDVFASGQKYRLEVTSEPNTTGNTAIPADGFVIHGRGAEGASDFVAGLKVGDIVEMNNIIKLEGEQVYPSDAVSGMNYFLVKDGVVTVQGNPDIHPRTGVGLSADRNIVYLLVVEGRGNNSRGVTLDEEGDIFKFMGADRAVNLDGGGSSTLYTKPFGVHNFCSDGKPRSVTNGIFATIEAPVSDTEITEIRFQDWVGKVPKYANYTPRIFGFNKYGVLVNDSVTGYTLTCPAKLGEITNNGETLFANGDGSHLLKAEFNGVSAELVVNIDMNCVFSQRLNSILIDNTREYPIELNAFNGVKVIEVAANALSWSSADASIASVSDDGIVTGIANGTTTVTGVVGDQTINITVNVEIPRAPQENILTGFDPAAWKFTKGGCNNSSTTLTATSEGAKIDYKVSTTRGLALTVAPAEDMYLWSLPTAMELVATPSGQPLKNAKINFTDNNGGRFAATSEAVAAGEKITYRINLADYTNLNDIAVFPIKLGSIVFTPNASTGATGSVDIHALNIIYGDGAGVDDIINDKTGVDSNIPPVYYNLQGIRVDNPSSGLYIERRGNRASKVIIK